MITNLFAIMGANFVPLAIAFIIGVVTGWWAWYHRRANAAIDTRPLESPRITPPPAAGTMRENLASVGSAGGASAGVALAADDLLLIKGIGPKINETLNGQGIARFAQIAAWTPADVDAFDDHLGAFKDRIGREEWIPQAKLLAAGNRSEWERLYGDVADAAKTAGAVALTAIGIPAAVGDPDSLLQIKGIGPKLNTLLVGLGITRFDQIAAWGAAEIDKVDDHLGTFKNRITRDNWIEQAGLLARGEIAAFEAKFGKLDSENV